MMSEVSPSSRERTVEEWLRHIQIEWQLRPEQMARVLHVEVSKLEALLEVKASSTASDHAGPTVPSGFEAAPPFIQIYRKLAARFPKSEDQVKWLFTEHPDFGGSKPIDVATSSLENLFWLGYYLDAAPRDSIK